MTPIEVSMETLLKLSLKDRECQAENCGRKGPRTIRRLNVPGKPVLCDRHHDEAMSQKGKAR